MKLYDGHVMSRVVAPERHKEVTSLKLFESEWNCNAIEDCAFSY